jgi:hypothetical protein
MEMPDWSLTGAQFLYLAQHNNMIAAAFADDDLEVIRRLAASEGFASRFGSMTIDEAYDRYLTAIEAVKDRKDADR